MELEKVYTSEQFDTEIIRDESNRELNNCRLTIRQVLLQNQHVLIPIEAGHIVNVMKIIAQYVNTGSYLIGLIELGKDDINLVTSPIQFVNSMFVPLQCTHIVLIDNSQNAVTLPEFRINSVIDYPSIRCIVDGDIVYVAHGNTVNYSND